MYIVTGGYKLGNTLVGQLWLIISRHDFQKLGVIRENRQLEKSYKLIFEGIQE